MAAHPICGFSTSPHVGARLRCPTHVASKIFYPLPDQKDCAIARFWITFNLGGGIGSFISFAINFPGTVSDATYGAFIATMSQCYFLLRCHRFTSLSVFGWYCHPYRATA
ncbi:hypothetical protein F5887DRAFT_291722 [Amanita rubescens]|nr:hypothetical protein F5887DRAFT_291722 [Amanita rubescens]